MIMLSSKSDMMHLKDLPRLIMENLMKLLLIENTILLTDSNTVAMVLKPGIIHWQMLMMAWVITSESS